MLDKVILILLAKQYHLVKNKELAIKFGNMALKSCKSFEINRRDLKAIITDCE